MCGSFSYLILEKPKFCKTNRHDFISWAFAPTCLESGVIIINKPSGFNKLYAFSQQINLKFADGKYSRSKLKTTTSNVSDAKLVISASSDFVSVIGALIKSHLITFSFAGAISMAVTSKIS